MAKNTTDTGGVKDEKDAGEDEIETLLREAEQTLNEHADQRAGETDDSKPSCPHVGRVILNQYEYLHENLDEDGKDAILANKEQEGWCRLSQDAANALILFYIHSANFIETETTLMVSSYVFGVGGDSRDGYYQFIESISPRKREGLVFYLGLIDAGLKDEMARIRERRDELIHPREYRTVKKSPEEILSELDQTVNTLDEAFHRTDEIELEVLTTTE